MFQFIYLSDSVKSMGREEPLSQHHTMSVRLTNALFVTSRLAFDVLLRAIPTMFT